MKIYFHCEINNKFFYAFVNLKYVEIYIQMRTTSYSISSTLGITEKINSKKCSGNVFTWKFSIRTQVKFGGGGGWAQFPVNKIVTDTANSGFLLTQ